MADQPDPREPSGVDRGADARPLASRASAAGRAGPDGAHPPEAERRRAASRGSGPRRATAAAVTGLVIEATRKMFSRCIGTLLSKAIVPIASTCVSPRLLTSVTTPDRRPFTMWRPIASCIRTSRSSENAVPMSDPLVAD